MAFSYPLSFNFSTGDQVYISDGKRRFILNVNKANSSEYMKVIINQSSIKPILDPDSIFSSSSTGPGISVYESSGDIFIKNNTGQTRLLQYWTEEINMSI